MNELFQFELKGLTSLTGANEYMISTEGDIDFIEASGSGRMKWEISTEAELIRTGYVNFSTDTAFIKEEGKFFLRFQNPDRQPFTVYVRVRKRKAP